MTTIHGFEHIRTARITEIGSEARLYLGPQAVLAPSIGKSCSS